MSNASMASAQLAAVRREMLLFVLLVPPLLVTTDTYLFRRCGFPTPYHAELWVTFVWFCLQTAGMAVWVGHRLHRSPWWWWILAWTVLLIDLQVFAIAGDHDLWDGPARALAYAFVSAQSGLAVVWGLLGSEPWRMRLPSCVVVLTWALSLGSAMAVDDMVFLMAGQTMATAAVCLLMRGAGFRFAPIGQVQLHGFPGRSMPAQFSIRHLFYWTTALAILFGAGRFFDWSVLLLFLPFASLPHMMSYTALLMLVSMVATWAAMGRESWLIRFPLGLLLLPAVGTCIGGLEQFVPQPQRGRLWLFWLNSTDRVLPAVLWTTLAGLFLACILLVFRAHGQRLYRLKVAIPAWRATGRRMARAAEFRLLDGPGPRD